jgi:hypothetical protein
VQEVLAAQDTEGWREVMDSEMENLKSHDVYKLVPCISSMHTLRLGWVLHHKFKNSIFNKNKAWLVARGNHQHPGIDYNKSFLPVMCLESLHTLLALAAICDLNIVQFNVTSAYLHGMLKEEIYTQQPDGYITPRKENWVWRLKKGLYRLVQVAGHGMRSWMLTWRVWDSLWWQKTLPSTSGAPGARRISLPEDSGWTISLG